MSIVNGECHGTVTRNWVEQPCGKLAAGMVRDGTEPPWPACPYHLNRAGADNYVPLADLLTETAATAARIGGRAALRQAAVVLQEDLDRGGRRPSIAVVPVWLRKYADALEVK